MNPNRPEPNQETDAVLAEVRQGGLANKRGRLKVYLGMAAGVGKTYSMLSDGQQEKRRGVDVLIGYVEPHGRKDTDDISQGLEQIPLQIFEHRGVQIREFDLDAALKRKPELLLVDELAHTNAEGARHTKRWQDIEELLEAGIDVCTTVNIQHVASLRDVVAQITGVFVQETVPDAFFEHADKIELVDIPPEELHQRLQEGKVYGAEKVQQALDGFFKRGNLLALRELSLRHVAEMVDEELRSSRISSHAADPWHTGERILACISPSPSASRVVRSARRLANNLHAELTVLSVESARQSNLTTKGASHLSEALELAESLGAETVAIAAEDIAQEVVRYAKANHFSTILIGKPHRHRLKQALYGSVVDEIIGLSGSIDVMVVTHTDEERPSTNSGQLIHGTPKGYLEAIGITAVSVTLGLLLFKHISETNIAMLFVLGITVTAFRHGRGPSLLAALLGVLAFDIGFVPPRWSITVSDAEYLFTFIVMLIVSLVISSLAQRLRNQNVVLSSRERSTAALYEVSRQLSGARKRNDMASIATKKVFEITGLQSVVAIPKVPKEQTPEFLVNSESGFELASKELATLMWSMDNHKQSGRSTDTLAGSEGLYLPLKAGNACIGILGIHLKDKTLDPLQNHLIEAIATQLASSLERVELARQSSEASVRAESERSRSSLLSAVSHDLRTPLAAIEGSATLLRREDLISDKAKSLAQEIESEAQRLGRLVRNLLDMSRVDGVDTDLNSDWHALSDLVDTAIQRTEPLFTRRIQVELPDTPVLLFVDGILIEQVLVNLLENAARHGGPQTQVTISARNAQQTLFLDVANDGPTIPPEDLSLIFEKFHRKGTSGFGLGLAICRAILRVHQGRIWAQNLKTEGVVFHIELPLTDEVSK